MTQTEFDASALIYTRGEQFSTILFALSIGLMSCSNSKANECPELASLVTRNAVQDATSAFAKGDYRLLSIGGFVGTTPGVEEVTLPTRELPGTGDMATEACRRYRKAAVTYAASYNRELLSLVRSKK